MRRFSALLVVIWVATLGADRINLVDGAPIVVTPFLVLAPIVVGVLWASGRLAGRGIALTREARQFAMFGAALLGVVWASVAVSGDPGTSAQRAGLLTILLAVPLGVVVLQGNDPHFRVTLARGAVLGIVLSAAVDVAQLAALFGAAPTEIALGSLSISLETVPYAGVIPRLSGMAVDPNRTGWAMLVLGWFVATGERSALIRRSALVLAGVVGAFTLSRSTLSALAVMLVVDGILRRRELNAGRYIASGFAVAGLGAMLWMFPPVRGETFEPLSPLASRFSGTEGSAQEHLKLIARGLEDATGSASRFALGSGYGTAYLSLQDIFPGNRYANFHSLYISLLAESGVFALLLGLALIFWPVVRGGADTPLVLAAAAFNVFYQASAEPSFWLMLAMAWILVDTGKLAGKGRWRATAAPEPRTTHSG